MSLEAPLCPICSAGIGGCDHEILRWSNYAGEYEESALQNEALRFEKAIKALLAAAWEHRKPPADSALLAMYQTGLEYIGEEWDLETNFSEVGGDVTSYVLDVLEHVPGVVTDDEHSTLIFWAMDRDSVIRAIEDRIRGLEIEEMEG